MFIPSFLGNTLFCTLHEPPCSIKCREFLD